MLCYDYYNMVVKYYSILAITHNYSFSVATFAKLSHTILKYSCLSSYIFVGPCYYAGSSQGGRTGEREENDSVIEGDYTDYQVGGLFDDNFIYSQFERDRCSQTA